LLQGFTEFFGHNCVRAGIDFHFQCHTISL
jgi:hypothetical protein